jgi:hypothetical protein
MEWMMKAQASDDKKARHRKNERSGSAYFSMLQDRISAGSLPWKMA